MFMLCCFSKVVDGELLDRVYHVFDVKKNECSYYSTDFVFDPIFKSFVHDKGYSWSTVPFSGSLVSLCGFDVSKCVYDEV